jgi:hypothetical protein
LAAVAAELVLMHLHFLDLQVLAAAAAQEEVLPVE